MRKTKLVEETLAILEHSGAPLTAPDILSMLAKKGFSPNKTTLYRILDRLQSDEQIEEVLLHSGVSYYESKKDHHHHFSCTECNKITCIEDAPLETKIHSLEDKLNTTGYQIDAHQFAIFGKCPECKL